MTSHRADPAPGAGTGGAGAGRGAGGGSGPRAGGGAGSGPAARPGRAAVAAARWLPGPALRRRAAGHPDDAVYPDGGCSYRELDLRARAVAARLGAELPPGERVLLAYRPGADFAGAFYGCLYAGMTAVPLVLSGGRETESAVSGAVRGLRPAVVLSGGDVWTALAVGRGRTRVLEAAGSRVGGTDVRGPAAHWAGVGVLRTAAAYQRYITDALGAGRLEPPLTHGDLAEAVADLARAERMGAARENIGLIASLRGLEDAVWRILLPVRQAAG